MQDYFGRLAAALTAGLTGWSRPTEVGAWRLQTLLRVADRRSDLLAAVTATIAWLFLLYLGRHSSFYADEWHFIDPRQYNDLEDWLRPWNEHWVTVPAIIYRILLLLVGLRTYIPFLAVLLGLHVGASLGLFVFLRRVCGSFVAFLVLVLFLFLGSGYQNLFWAFQIGFVSSVACGIWALVLLQEPRRGHVVVAVVLLSIGLASSLVGVVFAGAALTASMADPRARPMWRLLMAPAVVFGVWFAIWGHAARGAVASFDVGAVAPFVLLGATAAIHAVVGQGRLPELCLYALLAGAFVAQARRRSLSFATVVGSAGLAGFLALLALGRGTFGLGTLSQPRYAYELVMFLLILAGGLCGRTIDPVHLQRSASPVRLFLLAAVSILAAISIAHNVSMLRPGAETFATAAGELRGEIAILRILGSSVTVDPPMSLNRFFLPDPVLLTRSLAAHGLPDTDALWPGAAMQPSESDLDRVLWRMFGGALAPTAATRGPIHQGNVALAEVSGAAVEWDGSCVSVRAAKMSAGYLTLFVAERGMLFIRLDKTASATIGLGYFAPPQDVDASTYNLTSDIWWTVKVPTLLGETTPRVRITIPPDVSGRLCSV